MRNFSFEKFILFVSLDYLVNLPFDFNRCTQDSLARKLGYCTCTLGRREGALLPTLFFGAFEVLQPGDISINQAKRFCQS